MKIKSVESSVVSLPCDTGGPPPLFAGKPWTNLDILVVRVETEDGLVGWGEAFGHTAIPATRAALESRLIGVDDARAAAADLRTRIPAARGAVPRAGTPRSPGGNPPLPSAPYSGLCGSSRADTNAVFASELALFTAEEVREEASRACDEVIVALGEDRRTDLDVVDSERRHHQLGPAIALHASRPEAT